MYVSDVIGIITLQHTKKYSVGGGAISAQKAGLNQGTDFGLTRYF